VDAPERVAVAVIRAWMDAETRESLKIRITTARDVTERSRTIGVAADIDDACAIVRSWLERFADATERVKDPKLDQRRGRSKPAP
jgi:hypothetical protein